MRRSPADTARSSVVAHSPSPQCGRDVEQLAIFTHDLFSTQHDEANRGAVAVVPADELDLAGLALHADRKTVDKVLDRLRPHP